jgi:DNA-binding beta-propeller fold protein YncE
MAQTLSSRWGIIRFPSTCWLVETFVYAVNESDATISALQVGSDGVLSSIGLFNVGTAPNAVASDPTGKFLYVTDGASNQMYGFLVQSGGSLVMMPKPFKTDNLPNAVAVDPRGIYVYVANYNANDVSAYTIDQSTGNATPVPVRPLTRLVTGRSVS